MLHCTKLVSAASVLLLSLCFAGCSSETVKLDGVFLQKDDAKTKIFLVVDAPASPVSQFLEDAIYVNASIAIELAEKHAVDSDTDDIVIFLREPGETTTGMSHKTSTAKLRKYLQQSLEEFDKGDSRSLLWNVSAKLPEDLTKASKE